MCNMLLNARRNNSDTFKIHQGRLSHGAGVALILIACLLYSHHVFCTHRSSCVTNASSEGAQELWFKGYKCRKRRAGMWAERKRWMKFSRVVEMIGDANWEGTKLDWCHLWGEAVEVATTEMCLMPLIDVRCKQFRPQPGPYLEHGAPDIFGSFRL